MPSPTQTQESTPRVNLRHERERRSLTIKDIHIRVGIPLEHIEALESGVVPQALRGKKLLRSKQAYLSFLGYPKHSKLDVRRRRRRTGSGSTKSKRRQRERTGSTEIVVPTTSKSIFTGFGLAVAMVMGLKTLSLALDNPSFSLEGMLDSMVNELNETEPEAVTNLKLSSAISKEATPLLTSTTSGLRLEESTESLQTNIDGLIEDLVKIEPEPSGPTGPNEVSIKVDERSRLFFVCDGTLLHKGPIKRGDHFTCNFSKKAIIDIHDPAAARITHNAKRVRPMGPQGTTRRLSFVHNEY